MIVKAEVKVKLKTVSYNENENGNGNVENGNENGNLKKIKYKFIILYHKCSIAEKLYIFLCAKFCHFVPWSGVYHRVCNLNK